MMKFLLLSILFLSISASSPKNPQSFGLQTTKGEPLELLKLETKAVTQGPYAEIQYTFIYQNPFNETIQTKFVFPQTKEAVFLKFEAILQNQTFTTKIVKSPAKLTKGLNSSNSNSDSIHLQPQENIKIIFSMVQPLMVIVNRFYELKLPALIDNARRSSSNLQQWDIQIEVNSPSPFVVLSNPTHRLVPELSEKSSPNSSSKKIYQAFWNGTIAPYEYFAVCFGPENLEEPQVILATHPQDPSDHVMLLNSIPTRGWRTTQEAQEMLENTTINGLLEMKNDWFPGLGMGGNPCLFVIDRSNSMKGAKIESLKNKLKLLIKDYTADCDFYDVLSFGSTFELYSEKYPQSNYPESEWIDTIEADMGGSDLLKVLKFISKGEFDLWEEFGEGSVIILTDGDVSDPDEVVKYMEHVSLIVGIGEEASNGRIESLARANGNQIEFVLEEDNLEEKIIHWVDESLYEWDYELDFSIKCWDSQDKLVFKKKLEENEPFITKWFSLSNITNFKSCHAKIYGMCDDYDHEIDRSVKISDFSTPEITEIWHKVASATKIKKIEREFIGYGKYQREVSKKSKNRIINLSLKYQILSQFTSLVLHTDMGNTKTNYPLSFEFFDLSNFDKLPWLQSPVDMSAQTNFTFPKNYIPLDSIQNSEKKLDNLESIDL